ncbi:hypothetical protein CASFOL_010312 [Castilleja foliolosa]|uniref:Zinc finger GRF-type domain-containing protein n=1 Tax=Castilleja foliolosa TaxID=1961234 RepID=A0ABD3DSR4_9LAMI
MGSNVAYGNEAVVLCHCGLQVELITLWTADNSGRRFQACPNYKEFFDKGNV